ncbi:hypothetical protein L6452_09139 [Arctium lappa]|uniref:Uncharacterized protein n=1 Tax=Arctium lappa TaxID=4217 RepID=A0ACB9DJJ1_ARCLA|nr:hypothetical protein L6452_09139 [Arctium lappa]
MVICKIQFQFIYKNLSLIKYGGGGRLSGLIATSFRHHFSHHLPTDLSSLNFLSCHFRTALIRSPLYETTHLAESQGIVPRNRKAIKKEIIIEHMKICSNLTQLECLYACMVKNSYNQDCFMINQFVSSCSSFSRVDYAIQAFTQMDEPNVFVYNAVIRACVCCFAPIRALEFYIKMLRVQIYPTSYTFSSVIKGCALVTQCRIGEAINGQIWKFGFKSHLYVQTALIDYYSCLGKIFESRMVFDEMDERDVFAWTCMISVHARSGDLVSARRLFDQMPERTFASWNSLIDGYARIRDVESAEFLTSGRGSQVFSEHGS